MYQFQALIQKIIQFGNSNLNGFIFFLNTESRKIH